MYEHASARRQENYPKLVGTFVVGQDNAKMGNVCRLKECFFQSMRLLLVLVRYTLHILNTCGAEKFPKFSAACKDERACCLANLYFSWRYTCKCHGFHSDFIVDLFAENSESSLCRNLLEICGCLQDWKMFPVSKTGCSAANSSCICSE